MSCLKVWGIGSLVFVTLLAMPVGARPSQSIGQDGGFASESEDTAIVGPMFQKNTLRFVPETPPSPVEDLRIPAARGGPINPDPWSRFRYTDSERSGAKTHPVSADDMLNPDETNLDTFAKPRVSGDDVFAPKRDETISKTLSLLSDTVEDKKHHGKDHGSCLIAVIFEAIKVPNETFEQLEANDLDLHQKENDIWQQLIDMMALDFIPVDEDDETDEGEEEEDDDDDDDDDDYDEDYYEDYYDEYDYDCEEGTECGDDTVQDNDFTVMSFPPMVT